MAKPSMIVGSVGKILLLYTTPRALVFSADPPRARVFTATVRGVTRSFQTNEGTALRLQVTKGPTARFEAQKASQIIFSVRGNGGGGGGGGLSPVPDGTYTVGLGISQNGTITFSGGIITAIQEAQV